MATKISTASLPGPFHTGTKPFKTLCRLHWTPLLVFLATGFFLQALMLAGEAVAQSCIQPPPNLVGWWPMDETLGQIANEISSSGIQPGVLSGTSSVLGLVSNARRFSPGDSMAANGGGLLNVNGNQVTIDAWIKLENNPTTAQTFTGLVGKTRFPTGQAYMILFESGPIAGGSAGTLPQNQWRFEYILTNSGGSRAHNQSTAVDVFVDGQFHHFAMTYNGANVRLYVDAVLRGTFSFSGNLVSVPNDTVNVLGSAPFSIDEVEIFDRALTGSEIQAIFAAGSAGKCKAPVANAGPDQTVNEGDAVALDGSGSRDPDGETLNFEWVQVAGPTVSLNLAEPVRPRFVAPSVPLGGATLTFELRVSDGEATSTDTVDVTVKNVNKLPVADAGADQTVNEGSVVTFDGSNSFDPDAESLTFKWVQTAGPAVSLFDSTAAKPTFTAPLVGRAGATLTFQLTVSDGIDSATDTVNVFVENVNHPPIANAGADQTRNEGSLVTLDATQSSDPDSDPLTYTWTQIGVPSVTLSDSHSLTPNFTAPLVGTGGATLVFQLVVNDGLADSLPDDVSITVLNVNDPPVCGLAQATPGRLWPPNHKLISVGIVGVTDPNNDGVTITITGVTQDEPVNGLGDGDTSPDAVIQRNTVLLRAERSGTGNGRVYQVNFTANDGQGGVCTGSVKVGVPHSMKPGTSAVDDGQLYDSTQP